MTRFDHMFDFLPRGRQDQTVYTFNGPVQDGLEHIIRLTVDRTLPSDSASLPAFAAAKTKTILQSYAVTSMVKTESRRLGNVDARELSFRWTPSQGLVRCLQYYFAVTEQVGLTFWCTYTETSYAELRDEVRDNITALLA